MSIFYRLELIFKETNDHSEIPLDFSAHRQGWFRAIDIYEREAVSDRAVFLTHYWEAVSLP